jgi:hypothetical protein
MRGSAVGEDSLTSSEAEVLGLVDSGLSNREVAATLSSRWGRSNVISIGHTKSFTHAIA